VETIMKSSHSILVIALIAAGASAAQADGLPTFERDGFPITLHQVQTLGSERVHEQAPVSPLTRDGMPASPHQLSVLKPRGETTR
jgi:hypothetical protein